VAEWLMALVLKTRIDNSNKCI